MRAKHGGIGGLLHSLVYVKTDKLRFELRILSEAWKQPPPAHSCSCTTDDSVRCNAQVILVGVTLGWATGLNKSSDVDDAAALVKW